MSLVFVHFTAYVVRGSGVTAWQGSAAGSALPLLCKTLYLLTAVAYIMVEKTAHS